MSVCENYKNVEEKVIQACKRAGRDPKEVTLIAVSKTKPMSMIEELLPLGVRDFGENKVQELTAKAAPWIPASGRGNQQRSGKETGHGLHPSGSQRKARRREQVRNYPRETLSLAQEIAKLPHIQIKGLMTIAPYTQNPEDNRIFFRNLRKLSVDIAQKNIDNVTMSVLSMGMTGDYEVAIEEGATHVRVGTGIFGERDYSI